MSNDDPILLELAQLPREKLGPFFVLGLSKDATKKDIDRHWADRLKWARKNIVNVPLEDINWARETLSDPQQRIEADVASLSSDLMEGLIETVAKKYHLATADIEPTWEPIDDEKDLREFEPEQEIPSIESVSEKIVLPDIPEDLPSMQLFLEPLEAKELDPWDDSIY